MEKRGEAKKKKKRKKGGMEIKGVGEVTESAARGAFILKSRWNKSAMRTCLKNEGKGWKAKGILSCFILGERIFLSSFPGLKSPG